MCTITVGVVLYNRSSTRFSDRYKAGGPAQVRAKYMALEPVQNRYVAHLRAIRAIQEYLVRRAERHAIPAVDNTNVDRSVAAIHATVFGCLRRLARVRTPACAAGNSAPQSGGAAHVCARGSQATTRCLAKQYLHCKPSVGPRDCWQAASMQSATAEPI